MLLLVEASGTAALEVTVGAGGTISMACQAAYVDNNAGALTPGTQNTTIANSTITTIVSQNATAGVQRNIKSVSIYNNGTATNLVTVTHTDGTTAVKIYQATLLVGESIHYDEGDGWNHYTVNGAEYLQAAGQIGASAQTLLATAISPTSPSTAVMAGVGALITPQRSGIILALFCGYMNSSAVTANEGIIAQLAWATGSSAPAAHATATGTLVGEQMKFAVGATLAAAGDLDQPIALHSLITGLTIGTEYWVDLQLTGITAEDVTILNNVLTLIEV